MPVVSYPFINNGNGIFRPMVPVAFRNPFSGLITPVTMCLLDTGADNCVMPQYIADITKHNLKGETVQSSITQGLAQNKVKVWKHTFEIFLQTPDRKKLSVYFCS